MLRVERLSKKLGSFVMEDVSFEVAEGDYFVLLGPSGTGKTVLLEVLTGIIPADSGRIVLRGKDITGEKIQKRKIGLVFQDQALFPHMSVRRNIEYGLAGRAGGSSDASDRVEQLADRLGISTLLERSPDTLSGGEAQRVALARVLATDPDCLLLDEPLSSLDTGSRARMRMLLRQLNRDGVTVIHVTHDYEEAVSLATRIGVMEEGRIAQVDSPDAIFRHPASKFVAEFIGIRNFLHGSIVAPAKEDGGVSLFTSGPVELSVLTDLEKGDALAVIRSEDVTISSDPPLSSARNVFEGEITDILPVRLGVEIIVDIGTEIAALVTGESVRGMDLRAGRRVFASIKASAVRIIGV